MGVYVKGAVIALMVMAGIWLWYQNNVFRLPVNQSPNTFKLVDQMETTGVPDFTLKRLDGSELRLSSYKGKIIIVNFWASWCNPCVEEFPSMIKLIEQIGPGVMIVAVATDDYRKDIEVFTKAFGLPREGFEIVWDEQKAVMKAYGVDKIPETFLVGQNMKLIRKVLGIENWASADALAYFKDLTATRETPQKASH